MPVDRSVRRENARAKFADDGGMHGLTGFKQSVRDSIGIDQTAAEFDEHQPHRALTGGNSSRQPHSKHQSRRRMRAALSVFFIRIAIVIGPTPPGTGVIIDATSFTERSSTSPAHM